MSYDDMVELFLQHSGDVRVRGQDNKTALDRALTMDQTDRPELVKHYPALKLHPLDMPGSKDTKLSEWRQRMQRIRQLLQDHMRDHPVDEAAEQDAGEALRAKGNDAFKDGQYEDALNLYGQALKHAPNDHRIYSNKAACHLKLHDPRPDAEDRTVMCMQDAMASTTLQPDFERAWERRVLGQMYANDFMRAKLHCVLGLRACGGPHKALKLVEMFRDFQRHGVPDHFIQENGPQDYRAMQEQAQRFYPLFAVSTRLLGLIC
ncbi:unnamed protein product [Vitrella brassicaformis CCMP3155]|uniref:Uncharacterized protein n=1 Tax=Vitrella brassicaformis (strain CCMP3155) TaxID=1169540 RepID=A0A0G4EY48_VITBC|nr:unnamed protein product [Vitrella brassicaformis CCMP3155]|mmetsp:Transcript_32305/g.93426  ORF Transcript_32305/g.93426 Transcript_32305/m.93426 type:complete len:262 (-) Transcript_32305:517-1302(-)|eukprot:CEM03695.1 unnamed protein product [Vitrella brassicaformis CCMP3155]